MVVTLIITAPICIVIGYYIATKWGKPAKMIKAIEEKTGKEIKEVLERIIK